MIQNKGNVLSNSFKTFEHLTTSWKMFFKMTFIIIGSIFVIQCLIAYSIYKYKTEVYFKNISTRDICLFKTYLNYSAQNSLNIFNRNFKVLFECGNTSSEIEFSKFKVIYLPRIETYIIPHLKKNVWQIFLCTCPLYGFFFLLIYLFNKYHKEQSKDKYIRGKVRVSEEEMKELIQDIKGSYMFNINPCISIPESIVTRHNFAIGKPGSGKSQLIFKIVEQIVQRDVKCIIHDFKGDFIPAFYNSKKHYIFNPLDTRHMGLDDPNCKNKGWTIFNELHTFPDVESIVASLIPENKNADPIWHTAPRDLLKSMLFYCMKNGLMSNQNIYDLILETPDKIKELMKTLPEGRIALKHLEDPKLSGQFNSIIATFIAPFQYLSGTDGNFSIEDWVGDPNPEKKIIFLSNQAKVQDTLKKLISTFFDFSTKALCSLPDDYDRRIYFILDEFGQLSKIDSVVQLLTQSRSKGGAVFILIQDLAQIEHIYGQQPARSIVNSCGNKFYFSVGDESTAEFISKEIGSVEIERKKESKSFGVENLNDNISIQDETVERRVALASEVMSQKSLSFFMQLTDLPLTHVDINYVKYPFNSKGYLPRDLFIKKGDIKTNTGINESDESEPTDLKEELFLKDMIENIEEPDKMFSEISAEEKDPFSMPSNAIVPEILEDKEEDDSQLFTAVV